jgi:Metallo-beta-lactamase superfamily
VTDSASAPTGVGAGRVDRAPSRGPEHERLNAIIGRRINAPVAVLMLVASCATAAGQEFAGREKLRAHSNEFRKEVVRVTDGMYVAVGYSASNVTLIQDDSGSIVVDTASNPREAGEVRAAFGNLLDAPVRAIIYTHGQTAATSSG